MEGLSDEEIVAQYREKPTEALLNELFGRYRSKVALWCYRFTGDRQSAADLAQEIFLKAYRNLNSYRGDAKFSTWMYSIARFHCLNEMKSKAAHPEHAGHELLDEVADDRSESIESELGRLSSVQQARTLMAETLDETERKVMAMHYGNELKLDVVTRLLELKNPSGAKAYIVSARRKLSAALVRLNAKERRL